jgi:hypothetical protein
MPFVGFNAADGAGRTVSWTGSTGCASAQRSSEPRTDTRIRARITISRAPISNQFG